MAQARETAFMRVCRCGRQPPLGSIWCLINVDRLIAFTAVDVLLCGVGLPSISRRSQPKAGLLHTRYLTRLGNKEGGLKDFKLAHDS